MDTVVLKGSREGVVVHLKPDVEFEELCLRLQEKIKAADSFLGSKTEVIVNTGDRGFDDGQAQKIKDIFDSLGLGVKKFTPEINKGNFMDEIVQSKILFDDNQFLAQGPSLIIRKNLRSGQSIYQEGTVIVFGDINPGAEVIATGHILVIGSLRGIAHAGAKGDANAVVFALKLQPTQLRIANLITRAPDEEVLVPLEPEIARIKNGMVVIEKYLQK
ncbi:MAG: septum site-determining protein MinC [Bacillota bacterium]